MISEILLFGDNVNFLNKVTATLENYSQLDKIDITHASMFSKGDLKAHQVCLFLCSDDNAAIDYVKQISPTKTAYVCSQPNILLYSTSGAVQFMGQQRHLNITAQSNQSLNLGKIMDNIHLCEPAIRESDLFLLDFNVLRKSEVANAHYAYPSGLFSENISQLCRYAGMNERSQFLILNKVNEEVVDLVAQCIWYFAEAASLRIPDHPYFTSTVDEYTVEVTSFDTMLSFFKSKTSGRWWVKIPDINENKWKSCSYDDYLMACQDNISPELLDIISVLE